MCRCMICLKCFIIDTCCFNFYVSILLNVTSERVNGYLYLFSDVTHMTVIVFDTNPSTHPLTTSNSASSLIQLFFGKYYHLILSLLLLWISLNYRSKTTTTKQFSILYICKYVTFSLSFLFIN
jgi:hypothetical protein